MTVEQFIPRRRFAATAARDQLAFPRRIHRAMFNRRRPRINTDSLVFIGLVGCP
jgi:hypothetical protein